MNWRGAPPHAASSCRDARALKVASRRGWRKPAPDWEHEAWDVRSAPAGASVHFTDRAWGALPLRNPSAPLFSREAPAEGQSPGDRGRPRPGATPRQRSSPCPRVCGQVAKAPRVALARSEAPVRPRSYPERRLLLTAPMPRERRMPLTSSPCFRGIGAIRYRL